MTITTNESSGNQEYELSIDNTGLDEIQKAIDEIEKLKNAQPEIEKDEDTSEETPELEESEAGKEEVVTKKEKKEDKLWKVKKDKYRALAEKEALMEENLRLKEMLNESLNSGTYHYGKSAYSDLEKAKEAKKRAIEEGNIDALIESDIALNKALNTVSELEKWAYSDSKNRSQGDQHQAYQESTSSPKNLNAVEHEIATDWLDNHSYLLPSSPDYNPKIANRVADFVTRLDENLIKNNQMGSYFSEQYFQTIENYIDDIKNESQKAAKKIESTAHVGGVRNSYSNSIPGKSSAPTQIILTADEKRMCANAGISEKDWLRYKLEDLKKR